MKAAIVILSDPSAKTEEATGRVFNALASAFDFKERGDDVTVLFQGAGVRWIDELIKADHPLHSALPLRGRHDRRLLGGLFGRVQGRRIGAAVRALLDRREQGSRDIRFAEPSPLGGRRLQHRNLLTFGTRSWRSALQDLAPAPMHEMTPTDREMMARCREACGAGSHSRQPAGRIHRCRARLHPGGSRRREPGRSARLCTRRVAGDSACDPRDRPKTLATGNALHNQGALPNVLICHSRQPNRASCDWRAGKRNRRGDLTLSHSHGG